MILKWYDVFYYLDVFVWLAIFVYNAQASSLGFIVLELCKTKKNGRYKKNILHRNLMYRECITIVLYIPSLSTPSPAFKAGDGVFRLWVACKRGMPVQLTRQPCPAGTRYKACAHRAWGKYWEDSRNTLHILQCAPFLLFPCSPPPQWALTKKYKKKDDGETKMLMTLT